MTPVTPPSPVKKVNWRGSEAIISEKDRIDRFEREIAELKKRVFALENPRHYA